MCLSDWMIKVMTENMMKRRMEEFLFRFMNRNI